MIAPVAISEICEERVTISTDAEPLDGILAYPPAGNPSTSVLIAGPHPLLGGNVENNVVRVLRRALAEAGCVALTFDYRPIEMLGSDRRDWSTITSEFWRNGGFAEEREWIENLRDAASALQKWCEQPTTVLAGYSFGCWATALLAATAQPQAIVLISPNPNRHDLSAIEDTHAPLLVVQSDNDFTCDAETGAAWYGTLREPKSRRVFAGAEHFFRGSEPALAQTVCEFARESGACGDPS